MIKSLFFMLSVLIVFLDTDYENGDFLLVFVKYECKIVSRDLKLTITNSSLLNLNKTGEAEGKFTIQKSFLIAHVISVALYSLLVVGLFVVLGIITLGESFLSPLFFALGGASACVGSYMIFLTAKRYRKTIAYLNDYYQSYVY